MFRIWSLAAFLGLISGTAFAQELKLPQMSHLQETDTLRSARLTPSEQQQVFEEIAGVSFDTPNDWEQEVRVRRLTLGGVEEGLVLQGTQLLCGGTGNCQTFVLRHVNSKWITMFEEQAPVASGFGFAQESGNGIKNFVISANDSAESEKYIVYKFDGKFYRTNVCYEKNKAEIRTAACK